jgi:hypothetical protein
MNRFERLDAAESAFFERQLETIKSRTYDIKYPELKSRMFVPVSNEVPSGSVQVTYRQYDRVGRAKIIKPGATDLPRVDVFGKEFTRPVRYGGSSYGWHILEIRQARLAGVPLDAQKAAAARRADEELIDDIAALGSPDDGISEGFLNSSAVGTTTPDTGDWLTATSEEIIQDVQKIWTAMTTDTKGIEKPNTMLVPDAQHAILATKPRSTTSDTTVLQFLLRNFPGLTAIEPWYRLVDIGAGVTDRCVLYNRSPEALQQEVVQEFEQMPVFQRGSNFEVETMVGTAGTTFYYPRSCRYMDGI